MLNEDVKKKSFWERPEGTTGMLAIGAGLVGLWFAGPTLMKLFDTAITLVGQAITLTILGSILFALYMVLSNAKFQTLISYMFKSAMRAVTGVFIEIDPIGIMRSYVSDLKKKRETMAESRDRLRGQVQICKRQIEQNDLEYEKSMAIAKEAKAKGMTGAVQVNSRQAMRIEKLNKESLGPMLMQMEIHLRALNKYYEVTGTVIDDLQNEVKMREMERKMMLESYNAMSAAKKILNGGTDQRELFDQAMEFVIEDYSMKMGEIDSFIETSKGFVEGLDLQNGVLDAEAMKRLVEWETKGESILLGNHKQQLLEQSASQSVIVTGIGAPATVNVDYDKFLNK